MSVSGRHRSGPIPPAAITAFSSASLRLDRHYSFAAAIPKHKQLALHRPRKAEFLRWGLPLTALEIGLALFDEGGDAFFVVLGLSSEILGARGLHEMFGQILLLCFVHQHFD